MALIACGGGSKHPTTYEPPATPPTHRAGLWFTYYGEANNSAVEVMNHTNIVMTATWYGSDAERLERTVAAMQTQDQVILDLQSILHTFRGDGVPPVERVDREAALTWFLTQLRNLGVLHKVVALYLLDEPDFNKFSVERQTATATLVRSVWAAVVPDLAFPKLAVIYGSTQDYPGLALYDWIGTDEYSWGVGVLNKYDELHRRLQPHQRTFLVPGGSPGVGGISPTPFVDYAMATPQVIGIMPFLWFDRHDGPGIRSSPRRAEYCLQGQRVTGKAGGCQA